MGVIYSTKSLYKCKDFMKKPLGLVCSYLIAIYYIQFKVNFNYKHIFILIFIILITNNIQNI